MIGGKREGNDKLYELIKLKQINSVKSFVHEKLKLHEHIKTINAYRNIIEHIINKGGQV